MVTYWDASALVPLLLREPTSELYRRLAREVRVTTWWGSAVECVSAIERRGREGEAAAVTAAAHRNLNELIGDWREIHPSESLRRAAIRLIRASGIRSGDALQLGAALIASNFEPHSIRFLTEDARLKTAAEREGFLVD